MNFSPLGAPLALVALMGAVSTAWAQPASAAGDGGQWGLGVGLVAEQRPYRGMDAHQQLLPLISYENAWLRVQGPAADLKWPVSPAVTLELNARYIDNGYEADDASGLAGMAERKSGVWLGGGARWQTELANVSVHALADAAGNSKGRQWRLALDKTLTAGRVHWTPRLALQWQDRRTVDYYHGVRASEAQAGRPAYSASAATNTEIGLRASYFLSAQQMLFVDVSATALGSAIRSSPLVDRSTVGALRAGYLYRF